MREGMFLRLLVTFAEALDRGLEIREENEEQDIHMHIVLTDDESTCVKCDAQANDPKRKKIPPVPPIKKEKSLFKKPLFKKEDNKKETSNKNKLLKLILVTRDVELYNKEKNKGAFTDKEILFLEDILDIDPLT